MEERRLGRYFHAPTETKWQLTEWGTWGKHKNIEDNRLTKRGIRESEVTTFAVVYPDGTVVHRTFTGVLPLDLDDLADYWVEHESL